MKPTKEEQLESIVQNTVHALWEKYRSESPNSYDHLFTICKNDIFDYVKTLFNFKDLVKTTPENEDGFYFIEISNGKYRAYEQERNIHFNESVLDKLDDVIMKYVEYKIVGQGLSRIIQ